MSQDDANVKIDEKLLRPIDKLIKTVKDQYGIRTFGSRKQVVSQAVKEFLEKHTPKQEVAPEAPAQ